MIACTILGQRVEYKDGGWIGPDNVRTVVDGFFRLYHAMPHPDYVPDVMADFFQWLSGYLPVENVQLPETEALEGVVY